MRILPARFVSHQGVSETGTGREKPKVMNTDARQQDDQGLVEKTGFSTSWFLEKGQQEHAFKANGKKYRAVLTVD